MPDLRPRHSADGGGTAYAANLQAHAKAVRALILRGDWTGAARRHASAGEAQKEAVRGLIQDQTLLGLLLYGLRVNHTTEAELYVGVTKETRGEEWAINVLNVAGRAKDWEEGTASAGDLDRAVNALVPFQPSDRQILVWRLAARDPARCAQLMDVAPEHVRVTVRKDSGEDWILRCAALGNQRRSSELFRREIAQKSYGEAALTAGDMSQHQLSAALTAELARLGDEDLVELREAAVRVGAGFAVLPAIDARPRPPWLVNILTLLEGCFWAEASEAEVKLSVTQRARLLENCRKEELWIAGLAFGGGMKSDTEWGAGESSSGDLSNLIAEMETARRALVVNALARLWDWEKAVSSGDSEARLQAIAHFKDEHFIALLRALGRRDHSVVQDMVQSAETVNAEAPHRKRLLHLMKLRDDDDRVRRWCYFGTPMIVTLALEEIEGQYPDELVYTLDVLNDADLSVLLRHCVESEPRWYEWLSEAAQTKRLSRVLKALAALDRPEVPTRPLDFVQIPNDTKFVLGVPESLLKALPSIGFAKIQSISLEFENPQDGVFQGGRTVWISPSGTQVGHGTWGKISLTTFLRGPIEFGYEFRLGWKTEIQFSVTKKLDLCDNWQASLEFGWSASIDATTKLLHAEQGLALSPGLTHKFPKGAEFLGYVFARETEVTLKVGLTLDEKKARSTVLADLGKEILVRTVFTPGGFTAAFLVVCWVVFVAPSDPSEANRRLGVVEDIALEFWVRGFLSAVYPVPLVTPSPDISKAWPSGEEGEDKWLPDARKVMEAMRAQGEKVGQSMVDVVVGTVAFERRRRPDAGLPYAEAEVRSELLTALRADAELPELLSNTYKVSVSRSFRRRLYEACLKQRVEVNGDWFKYLDIEDRESVVLLRELYGRMRAKLRQPPPRKKL